MSHLGPLRVVFQIMKNVKLPTRDLHSPKSVKS